MNNSNFTCCIDNNQQDYSKCSYDICGVLICNQGKKAVELNKKCSNIGQFCYYSYDNEVESTTPIYIDESLPKEKVEKREVFKCSCKN